ncbi:MAG: pilus assembly protein N-terminal domain-containing protein [Candidatus Obscuribacter sp.]|nr:pilus assembly protein N-terminal domain-containing protein [Candidatus Obscuribacter sp.]
MTSQPIPPVVNGVVEFEEFKTTNAIDLKVSQSRTFKFKNKIVRTSISDPGIAEPVVGWENQMVLLSKSRGTWTMLLWDDAVNSMSVDLRVCKDYSQLQATLREIDPRIIVKAYNVGGSDRVLLTGDVDHPESIIRVFAASNGFMDDRGMNIQVANSRIIAAKIGESGTTGGAGGGGGGGGQLAQLNSVDRYTFFGNIPNNIGKAQVMLSDGGRVTSLVKVRKVPLIALHVSFMEMNTAAARELGTQLGFGVSGNGYAFGVGGFGGNAAGNAFSAYGGARFLQALTNQTAGGTGGIPVTIGSSQAIIGLSPSTPSMQTVSFVSPNGVRGFGQPLLLNAPATLLQQAVLLGTPGGASITPGGLINMFTGLSNFGRQNFNGSGPQFSVNPTIQGIISNRRARVLAEPTLVTISGERASFLAGGEIPIIQQVATAGTALNSVTFEPFGMRINMIPVLQENGTINLEVSPEERILSAALAFSLGPGTQQQIPGFTTRKSQTIVELKPGQELFLCGLVSSNNGRELSKLPMLGEIPVLGALYRSKAFNKNESELVVSVRPEIILPVLLVNSSCPKKSVVWKDLVT